MTVNEPEYYLVDEMAVVVNAVKVALALPVLGYYYGYIRELDTTLQQAQKEQADPTANLTYPFIWIQQPFKIHRGQPHKVGIYGRVSNLSVLIVNKTDINWKASERMANNYKPILYPIKRQLIKELNLTQAFAFTELRSFDEQDVYYWGSDQKQLLVNPVDICEVSNLELDINDNPNGCVPQETREWQPQAFRINT